MLSERYRTHMTLTLTAHLAKGERWFYYAQIPGFLADSEADDHDTKQEAIDAGLVKYPQAEVQNA